MNKEYCGSIISACRQQRDARKLFQLIQEEAGNTHLADAFIYRWIERRDKKAYEALLPSFRNRKFLDIIYALSSGSRWLDYGCGDAAIALQEVSKLNLEIICDGITFPLNRQNLPEIFGVSVYRTEGEKFLLQHINYYDLITSVQAMRYSPDQLSVLKKAYRALKINGILLVDSIVNASMPIVDEEFKIIDPKILENKLIQLGYAVEIKNKNQQKGFFDYSLAIQKIIEKPKLTIPVRLITMAEFLKRTTLGQNGLQYLGTLLPDIQYVYQLVN